MTQSLRILHRDNQAQLALISKYFFFFFLNILMVPTILVKIVETLADKTASEYLITLHFIYQRQIKPPSPPLPCSMLVKI